MNLVKKKNEFLGNQFSSQDEKMKSLKQKLAESEAKFEILSNIKLAIDNKSISISVPVPVKPKDKIYTPHFKRNHKEKAYVARLDKGKSFDIEVEVSRPVSKPTIRVHKKSVFVPTCHLCGIVGHIRPNCYLRLDLLFGILIFLNLFLFVTFVMSMIHSS